MRRDIGIENAHVLISDVGETESQDFSKILVVLGFEIQGGSCYPYKANGKINRVKTTTCQCNGSVQVGVRQNFVQHLFLGGEGAAREARGALAQIASA